MEDAVHGLSREPALLAALAGRIYDHDPQQNTNPLDGSTSAPRIHAVIAPGDLAETAFFLAAAAFCCWHGVRGLRGGPVWVDASIELEELRPEAIQGKAARALGSVYLITAAGCIGVVLQKYF